MSLSLTVRSRGGKPSKRFPLQLSLAGPSASVGDLKAELTKAAKARHVRSSAAHNGD